MSVARPLARPFPLALAILAAAGLSAADGDYRVEVGAIGVFENGADDYRTAVGLVYGRLHFWQVRPQGVPLAEADFLHRVPYVQLAAGWAQMKDASDDTDGFTGSATLVLWAKGIPVAAELTLNGSRLEGDDDDDDDLTVTATDGNLKLGWWAMDSLLVGASFGFGAVSVDVDNLGKTEYDLLNYGAFAKYVRTLPAGTAVNLEAAIDLTDRKLKGGSTDTDFIINVAGDFYLNERYSIGGEGVYRTGDSDDERGQLLNLRGRAFITPEFFVAARTGYFFADKSEGEDSFSLDLQVGLRF